MQNHDDEKDKTYFKGLRPLKSSYRSCNLFGFDIETANNNQDFVCCSIIGDKNVNEYFDELDKFKKFLTTDQRLRNGFIYATNLMFDFFGVFPLNEAFKKFFIIDQQGKLIFATTYISYDVKDINFIHKNEISKGEIKDYYKITFCDTMGHYPASVEKLGKLVNVKKLSKPKFLGEHPKNDREREELKIYNLQDSKISYLFIKSLQDRYNELNITMKSTISSTALDNFRRNHLTTWWKQEPRDFILNQYKAYHGGRTETIKRGYFNTDNYGKINVYDVNSLYPRMLKNNFPYPEGKYYNKVTTEQILNFEGICKIMLQCKDLDMPLLPVKTDKLRFPNGLIDGIYDFYSLRKALKLGYEIINIEWGLVYENKFSPFRGMIDKLYKLKSASIKEPLMYSTSKILMNGFYGKLGYNYANKTRICTYDDLDVGMGWIPLQGELGDVIKIMTDEDSRIPSYVFPIIPVYVTAMARCYMYDEFKSCGFHRVFNTDTDCIFTDRKLNTGTGLGALKLESKFKELILVRPKFYGGVTIDGKTIIRVKGMSGITDFQMMKTKIEQNKFEYVNKHFIKLRGAISRRKPINSIEERLKRMSLNDDKRIWDKSKFTMSPQNSKPYILSV